MNILPIVFAFMLIFSFLTAGFIHDNRQSRLAEHNINIFRRVERVLYNNLARRQYQRIPVEATPSTDAPVISTIVTSRKSSASYGSKRAQFPPSDTSKLNLSALIETTTNPQAHPLYEVAARLLYVLYHDVLFSKEKHSESLEYQMLDAMLRTASAKKQITKLADLFPDIPDLQPLFYKMLKGTNRYDMQLGTGIPPLEDFICLPKGNAIHFSYSSPALLEALFGKAVALKILKEEEKRWESSGTYAYLTKDDITALLANDANSSSYITTLGAHLNFSKQPGKKQSDLRTG